MGKVQVFLTTMKCIYLGFFVLVIVVIGDVSAALIKCSELGERCLIDANCCGKTRTRKTMSCSWDPNNSPNKCLLKKDYCSDEGGLCWNNGDCCNSGGEHKRLRCSFFRCRNIK